MEDDFGDPVLTPVKTDTKLADRLQEFARALNREVCVRTAGHSPANMTERRWKREGAVEIIDLDVMRDHCILREVIPE